MRDLGNQGTGRHLAPALGPRNPPPIRRPRAPSPTISPAEWLRIPRPSCRARPTALWTTSKPVSRSCACQSAGMYATFLGTAAVRRPGLQTHPVHHPAPGACALRADASRAFERMSREMPETKNCIPKQNKDCTRFKLKVSLHRPRRGAPGPREAPSVHGRKCACQRAPSEDRVEAGRRRPIGAPPLTAKC